MNHTTTPQDISRRFTRVYYILYGMRAVHTRKEFCLTIGLQPQNFHAIEKGDIGASISMLCSLIINYGINPTWLMTGEGEVFTQNGEHQTNTIK